MLYTSQNLFSNILFLFFFILFKESIKKQALILLRARSYDQKCDLQKINIFID